MNLADVPKLGLLAFRRACHLLDDVAGCPDEQVDANLQGLQILRDVMASSAKATEAELALDGDLFVAGLRRVVAYPFDKGQAVLAGAAAGILFGEGRLTEEDLMRIVAGYLGGSGGARKTAGILRGLLATAREIAWQLKAFLQAIYEQFCRWDQEAFLAALPDLRLAFADLTPREIVQVADQVSGLHRGTSLGELVVTHLEEAEVALGLRLSQCVRGVLLRDGLDSPFSPETPGHSGGAGMGMG